MKKYYFVFISLFILAAVAAAQEPVVNMQLAKAYQLGPGDEVTGKVFGEDQFNFVAFVNEDGKIEVPFSEEPILAKCKTQRQLRTEIGALLAKYLKAPQLTLTVKSNSRPPVTLSGEVNSLQPVILMRKATLLEVLSIAGGVKEEAGGLIQVFRTQPPMCSDASDDVDWKAITGDPTDVPSRMFSLANLRLGKEEANPVIYPGDVIVVKKAAPVYVTGEVVAPQGIYIKEDGLTLTEAIAKLGGVRREAKTKDIKIYRLKANSKEREVVSANYDQIKKGLQKDILLEPYDIVEVDKAKDSILQAIAKVAIGAGKTVVGSLSGGVGYRVLY